MLQGVLAKQSANSLMGDYASLLGTALLRQRTQEAEQAAQIESELASRVKSEFISNMSHELRTPLNTVIGFSKILSEHQNRKLPEEIVVEYANLIQGAASHLLSVINDILDISKMQSGRYTLDESPVNLNKILDNSLLKRRPDAEQAGVRIINRISKNLPELSGDQEKLHQVFDNLILNAIKFTASDGQITVTASRKQDNGAAITIADTGLGMSEDEIRLALEPFAQVDGTHSRWREGTGLGLPIARALVDLHGGQLDIQSTKGEGTSVTVHLPSRLDVSMVQNHPNMLR